MCDRHIYFMQQAYELAKQAEKHGEVPIAAVVVLDNKIIGQGYNRPINSCDPTAHAEMIALREAGLLVQNYRLTNATVYVTLEPCVMCAGAMVHARIKELIFGAYDPKTGAVTNAFELFNHPAMNHQIAWKGGIFEQPCSDLLKGFFQQRR